MSDNKKYYYLKLKDNFFDSESIKILEQQENGYVYSNLYLKLCLMSLKGEGRLLFRDEIPYDEKMIATITGIPLDNVRAGLVILQRLGLIRRIDSGEIYMSDIQAMIGHGSSEAERIAEYRKRMKSVTLLQNCTPEKEKEKEKELEKEKKEPGQAPDGILSDNFEDAMFDNMHKAQTKAAFEYFWQLYDYKTGRAKSEKIFNKINPRIYPEIMEHVKKYVATTVKESNGKMKIRKHPETYLRNESWNDEIIQPGPAPGQKPTSPKPAPNYMKKV